MSPIPHGVENDLGMELGVNFPKSLRGSISYVDEAGLTDTEFQSIRNNQEIASAIEKWMQSLDQHAGQRAANFDLFNRRGYSASDNIFKQFAMCEKAIEFDDILGTIADVTERVAIDTTAFEMFDEDQQDVWEQVAEEINLDGYVKSVFRELYKFSNCFVGVLWDDAIIQIRTKPDPNDLAPPPTEPGEPVDPLNPPLPVPIPEPKAKKGNRNRKKKFAVTVPSALTVFDVTKVLPVGQLMFGKQRYAYIADDIETQRFGDVLGGEYVDDLVLRLIERKYNPSQPEIDLCTRLGINPRNLWLFKQDAIIHFHDTKADYERWAMPRLKSVFELLDMKNHLRASDRASLVGATNFIVVIKKGTDKWPARPKELESLGEQARTVAKMPVLIGDHRLSVEIVTPKLDHTLDSGRWDTIDDRLLFRALETFSIQRGAGSRGNASEVSAVIARGLESRRDNVTGAFIRKLLVVGMMRNPTALDEKPFLHCNPRRVTLDINADLINAVVAIRDRGDISRQTTLEELGYNQDVEAMRRAREKARYDAQFQSIVPHASPAATPYGGAPVGGGNPNSPANTDNPRSNGAQGGRPRGPAKKTAAAAPAKKTAPRKSTTARAAFEEDRPATEWLGDREDSEPDEADD